MVTYNYREPLKSLNSVPKIPITITGQLPMAMQLPYETVHSWYSIERPFNSRSFQLLVLQMSLTKKDPSLRVAASDPHLVSLGGGRLSTAVTIHYIHIGEFESSKSWGWTRHERVGNSRIDTNRSKKVALKYSKLLSNFNLKYTGYTIHSRSQTSSFKIVRKKLLFKTRDSICATKAIATRGHL